MKLEDEYESDVKPDLCRLLGQYNLDHTSFVNALAGFVARRMYCAARDAVDEFAARHPRFHDWGPER